MEVEVAGAEKMACLASRGGVTRGALLLRGGEVAVVAVAGGAEMGKEGAGTPFRESEGLGSDEWRRWKRTTKAV